MKTRILLGVITGAFLLSVGGCGSKDAEPETETEEEAVYSVSTEAETEEAVPVVTHEGESISPFTGLWVDEEIAGQRPVAVMTENTKAALPQYGLSYADVIYECPVEGGISRLMAIYQDYSGMEKIGNVRSCRLYYIYFAKEFDAIYIHAGESRYAVDVLDSTFIDNIDGITGTGGNFFYRDSAKEAPHNYYTTSEMLSSAVERYGYDTELPDDYGTHWQFASEDEPNLLEDGEDAVTVSMYYQNASPYFTYNADDGLYYRFEFGAEEVDGLTGEQLAVTNIIIQDCYSYMLDSSDGTLSVDWSSGGTGKYITMGKAIDITWTRESDSSKTVYLDENGDEITLNPGKTWVEITQSSQSGKNTISAE
ncbi:MAG: DUF3048 domain-containing protein [Clostridiales bacterium]|nr:DUF3048 domain-containing protein [Clostridiales bacterium]